MSRVGILKTGKKNWKYILTVVVIAGLTGGGIAGWYWWEGNKSEESGETRLPQPGEPNVITRTDLKTKIEIDPNDTSAYETFIQNNSQYAKPISEEELQRQIEEAINYLELNPSGKQTKNLRQTIIEKLNIGMLLEGLEERELIVTTTAINERDYYTEKRLLFTDSQAGAFPALLLIPKQELSSHPAIIGLHGHGDSPEIFRDNFFAKDLVKEGFVVVMPMLRAMYLDDAEKEISKNMLLNGFNLMGMRVYETLLLIKYLDSSNFVDDTRIGIYGHSGGSETASLASRVTPVLKAGIYDFHSTLLDFGAPDDPHDNYHCQVVPPLSYYMPSVNDHSTLSFPGKLFDYKYPGKNDRQKVIDFFKDNL